LELLPQVAIARTPSYQLDDLRHGLTQALEPLGGLGHFVKPGMKVLVKPNLLSAKGPDRAITTHPELVGLVATMARDLGAEVMIGDAPGGGRAQTPRVWHETGLAKVAQRENLSLVNFELEGTRPVQVGERTYYVARPVLEADLVINLPKLKTHVLTLMTGGIKNCFGAIPGFRKAIYHKDAPNPRHFAHIIVDVFSIVNPGLTIMDAVLAMEGEGPSSGQARHLGLLLASADTVALDTVAAEIIGLPPEKVHLIRYAAEAGLGIGSLPAIKLVGEPLERVRVADFKLTSNRKMELLPKFVADAITPFIWLLPKVEKSDCIKCGDCVKACPTSALSQNGSFPVLDKQLCINCWCCHEMCPTRAISIESSWLARRLIR
jgi:uncharacterized protein (DUF362 family)/Pyruvate/2-oxoacid:ferredoxin oxidoreductase delta subunit